MERLQKILEQIKVIVDRTIADRYKMVGFLVILSKLLCKQTFPDTGLPEHHADGFHRVDCSAKPIKALLDRSYILESLSGWKCRERGQRSHHCGPV